MAPIHSLPDELLTSIFRHLPPSSRVQTLLSTSLVCSHWTTPSQAELWLSVSFKIRRNAPVRSSESDSEDEDEDEDLDGQGLGLELGLTSRGRAKGDLKNFVMAQASRRRKGLEELRTVRVGIKDFRTSEEVLLCLSNCAGVRKLKLNVIELDPEILEYPGLSELKSFALSATFRATTMPLPIRPLSLPFNLSSLSVFVDPLAIPPPLLQDLLATSPSLTSLSLSFRPLRTLSLDYLPLFAPSSPKITSLTLRSLHHLRNSLSPLPDEPSRAYIHDFFSRFSALRSLTCWGVDLEYLGHLPLSLVELRVNTPGYDDDRDDLGIWKGYAEELRGLVERVGRGAKLERVELRLRRVEPSWWADREKLERLCIERGVELDWKGDWQRIEEPKILVGGIEEQIRGLEIA